MKNKVQTGVSFGVGFVIQFSENAGIKPVLDKIFGEWTPKQWIAQNPGYVKGRRFGSIFGLVQAAVEYTAAASIFTGGNGVSYAGAPWTGGASLALSPASTIASAAVFEHAMGVLGSTIQTLMNGDNYSSSGANRGPASKFEKEISRLSSNERVARVTEKAQELAKRNGWKKNKDMMKKIRGELFIQMVKVIIILLIHSMDV